MNKSITPVISVILLILMTIVATGSAYFFINSNILELESRGNLESYPGMDNSKLIIASIKGDKVIVRNDGTGPINDIILFINGELLDYDFNTILAGGEIFEITYNPRMIGEDLAVKIVYNKGKISQSISPARLNTLSSGFTDAPLPLNS